MTIVTGAAGFIGSQLFSHLKAELFADQLIAVDHPRSPTITKNWGVLEGYTFLDHATLLRNLATGDLRPSMIIHLGACSDTTQPSWEYLLENNVRYSQTLWEWCARNGSRFIYASSAATYGDGSLGFDDEKPISLLKPLNLYGQSKHDFDVWAEQQTLRPIQAAGLKFFNVFGPGEDNKGRMASMVYHGYHQIRKSGAVRLFQSHKAEYSDGGQLRDFVYVRDVVRVIDDLIKSPEVSGLFNLGTGKARSFLDLALATFSAMGVKPSVEFIPMPEDLRGKYQYFTEATMVKLAKAGITPPQTALEEAVRNYVETWLATESGTGGTVRN